MEIQALPTDPFKALCRVASENAWCWKIYCSTCGHMQFQYGLIDIALGEDPANPNWSLDFDLRRRAKKGPRRVVWSPENQASLIDIACKTDIRGIAAASPFPDWLGYLGLVLYHTSSVERKNRKLSNCWTPQLINLVQSESASWRLLHKIFNDQIHELQWQHLGLIELDCKDLGDELGFAIV